MVALPSEPAQPSSRERRRERFRRTPLLWRLLMQLDALLVVLTGRLVVTGEVPEDLRDRPVLLASNHIGNADPLVLLATCRKQRLAPRFVATGGLFDTPVLGQVLRACGHIRADRGKSSAAHALDRVVEALRDSPRPVVVYPEGRISLEPGLWPERGKTGVARMALASGAVVIPVSQWGAHEAMCYGMVRVTGLRDVWVLFFSWLQALRRRPVLQVYFGEPVDLSGLSAGRVGDAARARDRIMRSITANLAPLRADEPEEPRLADPTRPVSGKRSPWRPAS